MSIENKISNKNANVAIIGLGYVGLPIFLSLLHSKNNYTVHGIDTDICKIESLKKGKSYIKDIPDKELFDKMLNKQWYLSTNYSSIKYCDIILICVPTPVDKVAPLSKTSFSSYSPDLSYVNSVITSIIDNFGNNDKLIILKSTVSPTTTDTVINLKLYDSLQKNQKYHLAFAPERENPADKNFNLKNTPMVVGGVTKQAGELAKTFLKSISDDIILLSDSRHAEMVKILENTFRFVNISLINEIKKICDICSMDIWEIIEGAKTKPFGFMPFYPCAGIGGHCIPVDPYYLQDLFLQKGSHSRFIEASNFINQEAILNLLMAIKTECNHFSSNPKEFKPNVLLLGIAYKPNINDARNSSALDIFERLYLRRFNVKYIDPYVPEIKVKGKTFKSETYSSDMLQQQDLVVLMTDHDYFDADFIIENSEKIFDTRGFFPKHAKVVRV